MCFRSPDQPHLPPRRIASAIGSPSAYDDSPRRNRTVHFAAFESAQSSSAAEDHMSSVLKKVARLVRIVRDDVAKVGTPQIQLRINIKLLIDLSGAKADSLAQLYPGPTSQHIQSLQFGPASSQLRTSRGQHNKIHQFPPATYLYQTVGHRTKIECALYSQVRTTTPSSQSILKTYLIPLTTRRTTV